MKHFKRVLFGAPFYKIDKEGVRPVKNELTVDTASQRKKTLFSPNYGNSGHGF